MSSTAEDFKWSMYLLQTICNQERYSTKEQLGMMLGVRRVKKKMKFPFSAVGCRRVNEEFKRGLVTCN